MTKRNGYNHEKLGITFQELGALLGVRGMLESGSIKHVSIGDNSSYDAGKMTIAKEHEFSMRLVMYQKGCGTLGCIGGSMALLMGKLPGNYVDSRNARGDTNCSQALIGLFFPDVGSESLDNATDWDRITPEVAVIAIDTFLAGKKVRWQTLVNKHGLTKEQALRKSREVAKRIREWNASQRAA